MDNKEIILELVNKARKAQKSIENYSQDEVDKLVKIIGKVVYDNAEELARMAVDESRMGVYEDKVAKNKAKAKLIWNDLKDKKSVGIIKEDKEEALIYVAKSIGIVGAATPCTNPIVTPMCNAMFAIKGRNAIIIAPHPRTKKCSYETVRRINEELKKVNAPENLIQIIEEPSKELRNELMKNVDAIVATGGMGVVRAAYSSGKPSYGVGVGNVQVILDKDIDFEESAEKIINGRKFDNGIICSGEQTIIVPKKNYQEVIEAFKKKGAFYIEDQKIVDKFRNTIFVDGVINRDIVGQSVQFIAEKAGVLVPLETKVVILKAKGPGKDDILSKEKLCPYMAVFEYEDFEEAVKIAQSNLNIEGSGHSAAIHSNNEEHIKYAGEKLLISRLVVNQSSSTTAGGSFYNSFAPTTTLGCGSWGNNSISENLTYKHLINISRIGLVKENVKVPSDDEIWS